MTSLKISDLTLSDVDISMDSEGVFNELTDVELQSIKGGGAILPIIVGIYTGYQVAKELYQDAKEFADGYQSGYQAGNKY